jgi:hypothetical protein
MFGYFSLSAIFFVIVLCFSQAIEDEPIFSKFKYDKQMLETMVRMEAKMDQWDKERKTFEENVLAILEHRREEMQEKFLKQDEKLENIFENFKGISGDRKNWTIQLRNITGKMINLRSCISLKCRMSSFSAGLMFFHFSFSFNKGWIGLKLLCTSLLRHRKLRMT